MEHRLCMTDEVYAATVIAYPDVSEGILQQIADISDNVEYTKNVMLVLQRLGLGFWEFPQGTVTEETSAPNTEEAPAQLPDPLPEEEEIQQ